MLDTREPSRGFAPARRTGIIASILPALDRAIDNEAEWLARIDRAPQPVRLAALLAPMQAKDAPAQHLDRKMAKQISDLLRALKFSNEECELAGHLVGVAHATCESTWTAAHVRRLLAELERDKRQHAVSLWQSEATPCVPLISHARQVLDDKHPLAVGDLAIGGKDLISAIGMRPGPALGRILTLLLDLVIQDPARNTRETLLADAQRLELELGRDDPRN